MQQINPTVRVLLPIGFFGLLICILLMGDAAPVTQATIVIQDGQASLIPEPEQYLPRCKNHADCPLPTSYCDGSFCTRLKNPQCACKDKNILRCIGQSNRVRHMYCNSACVQTERGALCQ